MLNIGLDFRIKAITGSIGYFNKRGTNFFGYGQIDYTGGVGSSILKNVASTLGNGPGLELNSMNIHTDNFNFYVYRKQDYDFFSSVMAPAL